MSPISEAVSPSTSTCAPPSPAATLAPRRRPATPPNRGHVRCYELDGSGSASDDEVGHSGLGDEPAPPDHKQTVGSK